MNYFVLILGKNSSNLSIASRFRVKTGDEDNALVVNGAAKSSVRSAKGSN